MRLPAPLIFILLLLPVFASADETLLVCHGETIHFYPSNRIEPTDSQITLAISGDYVQASDVGRVKFSNKSGNVWVWNIIGNFEGYLYNLDTISSQLTKIVSTATDVDPESGMGTIKHIVNYQCQKVEKRLVE